MSEDADVDRLTAIKELLDYCIRKPDTQYAYSRCRICDQSFWDTEEHRFGCKLLEWREALRDQALSQEAVRDEALREIIDELAAIADACVDLQQNRKRQDSDPVMGWDNAPLTLGTLRKARALKREPNAAAQAGPSEITSPSQEGREAGPAPAAPDVESMVKRLENAASAIPGLDVQLTPETTQMYELFTEAAALLAKLGQGWIPPETVIEIDEDGKVHPEGVNLKNLRPGASDE